MASFEIGNPFWQWTVPEYELEGYWTCDIKDTSSGERNQVSVATYMPLGFDKYVQSVSIPQTTLNYENNEWGLISFKEKSPYDDVTITFYDDTKGTCLGFFTEWLHSIYHEFDNTLQPYWRYQAKTISVTYFRQFFTGIEPIASYKMIKCLPKSISEISAEEEAGTRKTFSVSLIPQRVQTSTTRTLNFDSEMTTLADIYL